MNNLIGIRTDASIDIGTGHVMRCLTLAKALEQKGASVFFICKDHKGNLIDFIENHGFTCHTLSIDNEIKFIQKDSNTPSHANWLGSNWETDAKQTINILDSQIIDWMIVDHYALDYRWEQTIRKYVRKIMVIDDLLDRQHDCDLILDQTYGRKLDAYKELTPPNCKQLIGTNYALLRPEFSQKRTVSLKYREKPKLNNILISLGGIDKDNITSQVLEALKNTSLKKECKITIIMGHNALWLNQVEMKATEFLHSTSIKVNVSNMAQLMSKSDLAIGAAGSTSWERCCLGVPTILLVLAENQKKIAETLNDAKAVIYLKEISELAKHIEDVAKNLEKLSNMSNIASAICDGLGTERTIIHLLT